ncbi:RHS repeat-associated core domain-containing protein [Chryseobacterium sp. KCF3-3]|uniref:RHS repeat-associated core domain-containing protein n=1 Tax=Chryseobacterium sp. KCF3-3 TaxID=3231511 RepID=UPI0038B35BF5
MDRANHYYPFGLEFGGDLNISSISPSYRYSSQGQENQVDTKWSSYRWRNYDASMGRFFTVDPLAEIYPTWSTYAFSGNRVIDARELEGLEPVLLPAYGVGAMTPPPMYSGKAGAGSSIYETAKSNAINNYNGLLRVIGTQINVAAAVGSTGLVIAKRVLNSEGDSKAENKGSDTKSEEEGVIYKRKDKNGEEKDYVGQAKNEGRYEKRKKEHQRKNPDADYDFNIIDRGKPGKDLDKKEQKHIDEGGGPTNKSNPNGGLENKRNQIKQPKVPKHS